MFAELYHYFIFFFFYNPTSDNTCAPRISPPSFKDRVSQQQAMVCSFISEHTLPFSIAPHLIKFAQALASDHKALQALSMERFCATYKLTHGVHEVTRKRIVNKLRTVPFSINLDEATSKSNKKRVLNILVCYFDSDTGESVTHLYSSVELVVVNASTVHAAVVGKLKEDGIPLQNLISSLSDSAAYMRGTHNGYEAKLRSDAPHLLKIDGDMCHHIHNIAREFSTQLDPDNHLARLLDDIHRDFVYSPDIREDFGSICKILGVTDKQPKERVSHRWLSLLDTTQIFDEMLDPLTLLYYSWLGRKDKDLYKDEVVSIYMKHKVMATGRQHILSIMRRLGLKNMTLLGKKRKQRVCTNMFDKRRDTQLLAKAVISILPMFKRFILAFETKRPMLHKLHDNLKGLFQEFIKCFIKAQDVRESSKYLQDMNLNDGEKHIPTNHIFTGKCDAVLQNCKKDVAHAFRSQLKRAFVSTAQYMQKKLPLHHGLLSTLSLLDPLAFGQTETGVILKRLPPFFPTIQAPDFNEEVMRMQSDMDIIVGSDADLDVWWNSVFKLKRYPSVEKVVTACLSIFTGPRVEQSFSLMNTIISQRTSSLNISTYEAILCIKYHLLALKTNSIKLYARTDAIFSPVDASIAWHLQTAYTRYKKNLNIRKKEMEERDQQIGCKRKASAETEACPSFKLQRTA